MKSRSSEQLPFRVVDPFYLVRELLDESQIACFLNMRLQKFLKQGGVKVYRR